MADPRRPDGGRRNWNARRDRYLESRRTTRSLARLDLTEPEGSADLPRLDQNTSAMPPPPVPRALRRNSSTSRTEAQPTQPPEPSSAVTGSQFTLPTGLNLPKGVTQESVLANLERIHQARQPRQYQSSVPQAPPVPQVEIDPDTLPTGVTVFCNRRLFTREIIFNFKRAGTIREVKALVDRYFAFEFKRCSIPGTVHFAGLSCIYHRSTNEEEPVVYGTFMDDHEFALWHAEISDGKAYTGQLMRIQVSLFTEDQLSTDQLNLQNWFSDPDVSPVQSMVSPEWLLDLTSMGHQFNDPRMFERDGDDKHIISIPAHTWRENDKEHSEKKRIRNAEYDIRRGMIWEIQGLRRVLREAGVIDIGLEEVREKAREAEDTERGRRVKFDGETQDFERMRELHREVEDRSDKLVEGVNERAFLNI